jgi:hypothetical protein
MNRENELLDDRLDRLRNKFESMPDSRLETEMQRWPAGGAEQRLFRGMLDERKRKANEPEQRRFDQAYKQMERHHREAKHLAWGAAGISIVSALAAMVAMVSAWFAWHAPQQPVMPAPTPLVVITSPSPAPAPALNPVDYISLRRTTLDEGGAVRMTIRNNNGFPIRNVSLRIVFLPVSRVVSEPVYQFQWFIPELIKSGEDLEFTAVDGNSSSNILASHSPKSTDEWSAKPEFISAESVPK